MSTVAQVLRAQLKAIVDDAMDEAGVLQTCLHCKRFNEAAEVCNGFSPPVRPPARVIVFGCASFDEVPE
jgi:hypothetical protein